MSRRNRRDDEALDPAVRALSETRPIFVDNQQGNNLDRAIRDHLGALRAAGGIPWEMGIASGFFTLKGFDLIEPALQHVSRVQLLLGAEPRPEAIRLERLPGDPPKSEFARGQVVRALHELDEGIERDRDLLPFDDETDGAIRRLLEHLQSGRVEVRRFEANFLHAKAYVFRTRGGGTIVGSSNLTRSGLQGNLELNLGHYEDPVVDRVEDWFDDLWDRAEPYDLASVYDRLMHEFDPYLVYLRVLYELYHGELETELSTGGDIPVLPFQQDGVHRAERIIAEYGGVLIADGVGLGKTFTAGELIRRYRERRQRVLLIAPAALRDETWAAFLHEFQLFVDCLSYEELAMDEQLGGDYEKLRADLDEYQLVVVDEAHNYRNPNSPNRARILRRLLQGRRRDVVLLSATPVNNSLWDLYYALRYFVKQDAAFAGRGVLSMRDRFRDAEREDPFDLNPDMLFPIIDATTVKRTRSFVREHYGNDRLRLPDGTEEVIHFPTPVASSIHYALDGVMPGFLDRLEANLAPSTGRPRLRMARYQPEDFPADADEETDEKTIVGLVRAGLLKRFESSAHAFGETCGRMIADHDTFLDGLDRGVVIRRELFDELAAANNDEAIEEILECSPHADPLDLYDAEALRAAVESDRTILEELRSETDRVDAASDPKLLALADELANIASDAAAEAIGEGDQRTRRKVLIFTAFADTVDWIESFLRDRLESDDRLAEYRGRMASVVGDEARSGVGRDAAVRGFAPETAGGGHREAAEDRFDILITTDVLAEGVNLQQCRNIVNFDLPWNPMRLVQRHGRIDRIRSPHDRVFLRTFFPDDQLDRLLRLENRVRSKLARAAASVGVETAPIEDGAERDASFSETRDEIRRLGENDATLFERGGTAASVQSGEEYRLRLRRALQGALRDEVLQLPWKAGSGLVRGAQRGHFFCARVTARDVERVYLRFVPADPDSEIEHELATCLRMIECEPETPRFMPDDLRRTAHSAWQRAQDHVFRAWTHETDPANVQPPIGRFSNELAGHLMEHPPANVDSTRLDRTIDAVQAPCSRSDERLLRDVFAAEYPNEAARSAAIIDEVERIGLEPFAPPEPLPPIDATDVRLVCWMAVAEVGGDPLGEQA